MVVAPCLGADIPPSRNQSNLVSRSKTKNSVRQVHDSNFHGIRTKATQVSRGFSRMGPVHWIALRSSNMSLRPDQDRYCALHTEDYC